MRSFFTKYIFLFGGLLVVSGLVSSAENLLRSQRNDYFEIVGLDLRSVSYVDELSLIVVEKSLRYLEPEGLNYPIPILVNLRPEQFAKFEGDSLIRFGARRSVQLDIKWQDPFTLERTCYLMAEALLTQYAVYNFGLSSEVDIPKWLISAMSSEVYFSLRPTAYIDQLAHINEIGLPTLSSILDSQSDHSTVVDSGFWILHVLKANGIERGVLRRLFQMALAGHDISEALKSAVQPESSAEGMTQLEAWWFSQIQELASRSYDQVESMAETRVWLEILANFDQPIKLEEGDVDLNLRSLWKYRNSKDLAAIIKARYEILELRLIRANPAYFNAAQSLGAFYDSLLSNEEPHRFIRALTNFLSDWEDAKQMQSQIESAFGY